VEASSVIALLRELLAAAAAEPASPPAGQRTSSFPAEDTGCLLWDLSASAECASVMLQNGVLTILQALLERCMASQLPPRAAEIALGILANLCTHSWPAGDSAEQEAALESLIDTVVGGALVGLVDDAAALCEACRCLSMALLHQVGRALRPAAGGDVRGAARPAWPGAALTAAGPAPCCRRRPAGCGACSSRASCRTWCG
jgi:hypothetical protein